MNEEEQLAALQARLQAKEQSIAQLEAMPDVVAAPMQELSWWQRGQQAAAASPSSIGTMTPKEYATAWTPSGAVQNLRVIPEEGASIAGSVIGGAAGTALGGPLGGILGGALGSYADVPIQAGLDYLTGTTPNQSRITQATKEAALGAGLETGLRGLGWLGRLAAPTARAGVSAVSRFLGPSTEEAAQRLIGSELTKSITREELVKAAAEKEVAGAVGQTLTTADITGSKQLARMQELLSGQPLGGANEKFAETATKQLQTLDEAALNMTALRDPNPKRAGEAARQLLEKAKDAQHANASAKFTDDLREIVAPATGMGKQADDVVQSIYKDSDVLGPSGELDNLVNKIKELDAPAAKEKLPVGFGREVAKPETKAATTTVGTLQDLRSQALEISRSATAGSRDELLADKLSEMLGKRIDSVEGTEPLKEAQKAWREYKQRWYRTSDGQLSPLAKLLRKQSPEDIIKSVSQKSAVSDEYAKVLGGLEPIKLASEMADFVQKDTVSSKLKWLRSKRAIYADSPIAPVLQEWEDALRKIETTGEAAKVKGLSAQNIDTQATSLIRALGGKREATEGALQAGALKTIQDAATAGIGFTLGGYPGALAATMLPSAVRGLVKSSTARTSSALAEALTDPATALKYIDDAAKFGKDQAAKIALQDKQINEAMSLVQSLAPGAAAIVRSSGMVSSRLKPLESLPAAEPTTLEDIQAQKAQIKTELEALQTAQATSSPEPTPQPESIKVGKQNISIPIGEQYSEPRLVKAVIRAESAFNSNAVSPKGAGGLMQIMPATAKGLGLKEKDRFDPDKNVEAGSRYLKQLENAFEGNKKLALAAYNWGIGRVQTKLAEIKDQGEEPTFANLYKHLPGETKTYIRRVMLNYNLLEA